MNENDDMDTGAMPMAPQPPMETHMKREAGDVPEDRRALVKKMQDEILSAKSHWGSVFDQMKRDMKFSKGRQWPGQTDDGTDERYVANFTQRHIQQRTASLYAKNPRFYAKRRKTVDFTLWDGSAQQLQQIVAGAQMMDPSSLMALQEIQAAAQNRKMKDKIAQTLEVVMDYEVHEQIPPFKTQMKQLIRRVLACKVGYLKIGFDRATSRRPEDAEKITDITEQIAYLQSLMADMADDEIEEASAEVAKLKGLLQQLQAEPEQIIREGLVFDFPPSWSIIIDKRVRHLGSFLGAQWIAQEFALSIDDVKDIYGVDLSTCTRGMSDVARNPAINAAKLDLSPNSGEDGAKFKSPVTVWEVQDKRTAMTYVIAEGYEDFLKEPSAPEVKLDRFWTLFPLMFNELEDDECPFPQSDVELLRHQQKQHNAAREGLREHRIANRPATVYSKGAGLSEQDAEKLASHPAHAVIALEALQPNQKIDDVLQNLKKPPIDPAMYETQSTFDDVMKAVGVQEANIGGTSGATATESSIAEGSRMASTASNVDDLDDFLNDVARASSQILFANMTQDTVRLIAGQGAVWPEQTRDQIARELLLEVEAGSSGRPNKAADIANLERMLPIILQIPGIVPEWVAQQAIRRLDDKADLSDAYIAGLPSIAMMNSQKQVTGAPPDKDPNQQGGKGGDNAAKPQQTDVSQGQQMPAPMDAVSQAAIQYLGQ